MNSELVISGRAWHRLRPLLVQRDLFAVGSIRRRIAPQVRELLVDDFQVAGDLPTGASRPPLDDWCVAVVDQDGTLTPEALIERLSPKASHLLIVIVLRNSDHETCQAAAFDQGQISVLDSLRVIGPGMLRLLPSDQPPELFDAKQDQRWSRTVGALGVDRFNRLRNSSATIIGAGRLGSQTAFQLAALGVGSLRLLDGDTLLLENLDAMPGLHSTDVGLSKVEALANRLCGFQPELAVTYLEKPLSTSEAAAFLDRRSDVLISCVDNDTARLAVSLVARRALMVHLDVASSIQRTDNGVEISADVRLLFPGEGCVACVGGLDDADRRIYDVAAPAGVLQRGQPRAWHEQRAGSLITINSIAAGTATQTYLDLFTSGITSSCWHRMAWHAEAGLECHSGRVDAGDHCRFCRGGESLN